MTLQWGLDFLTKRRQVRVLPVEPPSEEKVAEEQALEAERGGVERLKSETSELMNRLDGLQKNFLATIKSSKDLLHTGVQ